MSTTAFTHSASAPVLRRVRVITAALAALAVAGLIALAVALTSSSPSTSALRAPASVPALIGAPTVPTGYYRDPTTHQLVAIPSAPSQAPSAVTAQQALTGHAGI